MKQIKYNKKKCCCVSGSFTVEAAWVMAFVLLCIMSLLNAAFRLRAETVGELALQREVEVRRHSELYADESEIMLSDSGEGWSLSVESSVFHPEIWLRQLSLAEGLLNED